MGSTQSSSPPRRLGAVVAVMAAVLAVVLGVSALSLAGPDADRSPGSPAAPAAEPDPAPAATLDLDRGPATDADVRACADGLAADPASVELLYAVRQRSADGDAPVLLLRTETGELRLCDAAGPDSPAQLPLPEASADEPVVFLSNGEKSWDCTDATAGTAGTAGTVQRYTATTWLAVGPEVATVRERYWRGGQPGPWFSTAARGGYAHLQTWIDGPVEATTPLAVETQALDAAGAPVPQTALSRGPVPLAGCTDGDVQIG